MRNGHGRYVATSSYALLLQCVMCAMWPPIITNVGIIALTAQNDLKFTYYIISFDCMCCYYHSHRFGEQISSKLLVICSIGDSKLKHIIFISIIPRALFHHFSLVVLSPFSRTQVVYFWLWPLNTAMLSLINFPFRLVWIFSRCMRWKNERAYMRLQNLFKKAAENRLQRTNECFKYTCVWPLYTL